MGKRTHLLLLVLASLVAGTLGSLIAVAATTATAQACSIAGPHAEVWPSSELRAGQSIEMAGWGFVEVRFHDQRPQPIPPADQTIAVPPELCDFDTFPIEGIDVVWHGTTTERLGRVSGPDFKLAATVPVHAVAGPAWISVGSVRLAVHVGPAIDPPPPPCPLAFNPDGIATHRCPDPDPDPDPWPCPQYATDGSGSTQPFPGGDDAPGFLHPCPEPCVDSAHTIDAGEASDYRWDCTDPCGYSEVNPGAPSPEATRCPPPPDPCIYYLDGATPTDAEALVWCPDSCGVVAGDAAAIWCGPPPDRCVYYADEVRPADVEGLICPDPCMHGDTAAASVECPRPVPLPDPPAFSADAAAISPDLEPQPVGVTETALRADLPITETSAPNPTVPVAVSDAVLSIAQWVMRIAQTVTAGLLG